MGFKIENGVLVKYIENVFSKSEVIVPDNVKKIGPKAFGMCVSVKSIALPIGVNEIGAEAFKGCTALEEINLPAGIKKIGAEAFRNCSSLRSIVMPVGVPEIREYTFCNCLSLKSVGLPDYLRKIEVHTFYGCKSLESIEIPSSVTEISDFVFCGCSKLTSIVIPENVTTIGSSSFWGCTMLNKIEMPDSLKEIGDFAFRDCVSLTEISIPDQIEKVGRDAFVECPNLVISVPKNYHSIRGSFAGYKIKEKVNKNDILSFTVESAARRPVKDTPQRKKDIPPQPQPLPDKRKSVGTEVKGFTEVSKPRYYHPGALLQTKRVRGYDISNTSLAWDRVPMQTIERMIDTKDYEADMYLPMKYSVVAAVFLKDHQREAETFIWKNTIDFISYFINLNDYKTVKGLFQSGKFITSKNILPLLECAVDKVQSGGDMKIQVLINNYYVMNAGMANGAFENEQYSEETRGYLHEIDILERSLRDMRMMLKAGADRSQLTASANELFGVFMDFRASLPDELSDLFNSYSAWKGY